MEHGASEEFLSVKELQEWLGLGRSKTFEVLNAPGGIPHYRVGRRIIVRRREVLAWLEAHRYPEINSDYDVGGDFRS